MAFNHFLTEYKVGEISQALLGRQKSNTNENKELNTLFRSLGRVQPEFVCFTPKTSNKTSKKSQDDIPENQDSKIPRRKDTIEETRRSFHHNRKRNLPTSDDEGEDVVQKKHRKASKKSRQSEEDPEKLSRTVFVGNLPVAFTRKKLKCLFTRYGAVESVRFRSAGLAKPDLSRKVAMKKREFHPDRYNINGYVVFKEKEYAIQALQSNGQEVDGLHIRVDSAGQDHQHDHLRSVFVGNLPFDAEEEMLRQFFVDCGEVEAVRIIRDSKTGAGKGFGFILFKGKDAVMFALKMNKKEFNGRKLRVFPSSENPNSGQAREFKKGKPVAYTFSGVTAKRANRDGNKGRKKKPDLKHAQGRQERKPPRNTTGGKKSTDLKRGGKYKDFNQGKHKTVRTRFLKNVKRGGENNRKRKHR